MGLFEKIWKEITVIGKWFAKAAVSVETVAVPIAIAITEGIKKQEDNGTLDVIAEVVDSVTGTHIATEANAFIKAEVPKALAFELGIQLPANPTPDDWKALGATVITAIASKDDLAKAKFYTNFATDVYVIVQKATSQPYSSIYAEIVDIIQKAYLAYEAEKLAAQTQDPAHQIIGKSEEEASHGEGTTS